MHVFLLAQLCLATAVGTGSPVEKVVELIKELKTKITTDGANEQKIYDKFACWCETTSQRKADAIDEEKKQIGLSTTNILMLKGAISVLQSEVADNENKIEKNEDSMKTETGIRTKENGAYQESKSYMETTLSSLHTAIEVLRGAGTGGDKGLFMMKVASSVRSAILDAPQIDSLPEEKSKVLKRFLEEPVDFLQQEPVDYYDQKAQAKASYSPASATIMGILKDMYDTFAADLEKSNTDESALQKAFEEHIATKEKANKDMKREILQKEEQSAQKASELSEAEATLAATTEQKSSDESIFESTRESCKAKSDEWDERGRLRTEQLVGINQALEILTSD
jgi:predicted  nucleic acid-binding Zn-ribbon protein